MDSNIDRDELEEFGLLFVLEEPIVKLDNGQQANAILIVDTARHEAKAGLAYKQMSLMYRDGRPVSDRQRMGPHDVEPARTAMKRPLEYVLVTDKEMKTMESARNVRKKVDELLRDLVDVASASEPAFPSQLESLYPSHPNPGTAKPNVPSYGCKRTLEFAFSTRMRGKSRDILDCALLLHFHNGTSRGVVTFSKSHRCTPT